MHLKKCCLLGLALASVPSSVVALGIRLSDQDARATARGNAFVATADNPSAIYYNPAGISQLEGVNLRAGVYGIYLKDEYRPKVGMGYDTKDEFAALPQLYSTFALKNTPLTLGLGVYSPYGLSLEWPNNTPFVVASIANPSPVPKKGSITYLTINPVVSWQICDTLSLGAGPTINYAELKMRQNSLLGELELKGDHIAIGANAGVLWKPHPKHAFGVSYRSPTTMDFDGSLTVNPVRMSASTKGFEFPQNIIAGWSFRPTPKWNLEFNIDWTDWDSLNTVTVQPAGIAIPFNWQSSLFYEFGATRFFDNGWSVSAGYIYSENSVPTQYFSPLIPDSDRHIFSAGVGWKHKQLSWDVAYQFAYGPERSLSAFGGGFTFISHALTLSVGYGF